MNREDRTHWFHGKINRETAEKLLKDDCKDGVFLVRDSNSSTGDYVLSVLFEGEVNHYQIRRHGDDAFFSIEEHTAFHGLDTLIEHYQNDCSSLVGRLAYVCGGGSLPPHDTRTHGDTNLLHRAIEAGNFDVVSELIGCGYSRRDAKNPEGQTAVHLASKSGKSEILAKLISNGANVNSRDTAGNTALHYACQQNFPIILKLLIVDGGANIQTRHAQTGKVPMHEAAENGHLECIKVLLSFKAPANPRTVSNEIPADLAFKNRHMDCYNYLKCYTPPIPTTTRAQWYHGTLSREEAVKTLKDYCKMHSMDSTDGVFLVRFSARNTGAYVLTLLFEYTPYHFIIREESSKLFIDDGPYLDSLEHLIDHYTIMPDGLPTCLHTPVQPIPKPPLPEFSTMPRTKKTNPHRTKATPSPKSFFSQRKGSLPVANSKNASVPPLSNDIASIDMLAKNLSFSADFTSPNKANNNNVQHDENTVNNNNSNILIQSPKNHSIPLSLPPNIVDDNVNVVEEDFYKVPKRNDTLLTEKYNELNIDGGAKISTVQEFIPQSQLTLGNILGEGEFGSVLKGVYMPLNEAPIEVAIKTLHSQHLETNKQEFLREACVMMGLQHSCIVRLIGIAVSPQLAMIQELAPLGSLLTFLLEKPEQASPMYELKLWACQVACGMRYLEEKRFIHRDLATRNILLLDRHQAKISDFGLSRALSADSSYYKASQGGKWPIKWYAPESYNFGTFSHKSDVWSFGVTLWEMYSYGKQPYGDKRGADVIELVEKGERLQRPEDCPQDIYGVMSDCWAYDPQERPTFSQLVEIFSLHPEYMNISQLVLNKEES